MSPALQIIGWLCVVTMALWATVLAYITAIGAQAGWVGRLKPVPLAIVAVWIWWAAWTSAPFSIVWGAA